MFVRNIYLIRHAETLGNLEKRYIGSKTDEELSTEGIERIYERKKIILKEKEYCDLSILPVYSSPMKRCIQTAKIMLEREDINIKDELREIDFGDFEGKNYKDLSSNQDYQKWIDSGGTIPFPNGESREDFIERSYKAFSEILEEEKDFVIVCHGGNIMAIMSKICGKDYFDFQVECAGGYKLTLTKSEGGKDCDISYNRLFDRDNS